MKTGEKSFTKNNICDFIEASTSCPGAFPPKVIDEVSYIDGGINVCS